MEGRRVTRLRVIPAAVEDGDGGDPTPGRTDGRRDAGEERR